jgi:hypothetical protein
MDANKEIRVYSCSSAVKIFANFCRIFASPSIRDFAPSFLNFGILSQSWQFNRQTETNRNNSDLLQPSV